MTDTRATALEKVFSELSTSISLEPKVNFIYAMEPGRSALAILDVKVGKVKVHDWEVDAVLFTPTQARALLMDLPHYIDEMEGRNG